MSQNTVCYGVAVAEYSGLISAAIRGAVGRVSPTMLTFVIALGGVTGSIASDAVFVILIPLGATAFKAVGRSPVVGAMVAFAASSASAVFPCLVRTRPSAGYRLAV